MALWVCQNLSHKSVRREPELQKEGKRGFRTDVSEKQKAGIMGGRGHFGGGNYISKQHLFLPEDHSYPHEYETVYDREKLTPRSHDPKITIVGVLYSCPYLLYCTCDPTQGHGAPALLAVSQL